ncbi:MAG: T9SS type A sorting domain-containing protein [Bacteroidetes bacterium]|nr:T9SS type A sorting domain-containing protein [Bacteroidota bacterium]
MIQNLRKQPLLFSTKKIFTVAAALFTFSAATANSWYVNDGSLTGDVFTTAIGNDANAGTAAAPFATIQFALDNAAAGDTIYVDAGTYTEATITIAKSNIVLRGAKFGVNAGPLPAEPGRGTDETTIEGSIYVGASKDGTTIDGFTIDMGSSLRGIEARGLNTVIVNNIVTGTTNIFTQQAGISTRANAPNRTHSYLISHNNVQNVRFGIYMDGNTENPSEISYNFVSNCFTAGYVLTASRGHHFKANVCVNNGIQGLLISKGGNIIEQNTFAANTGAGIRIAGTAQNFGNVIINNFITANQTGIALTEDDAAATNNQANYNFLAGNTTDNINSTHTASFNATCNWFGTIVPALIATQLTGNITFNPFLTDGIDTDLPLDGFQPNTTCVVLPVVLTDFTAQVKNYDVVLNWQTASEINSSHFNIERSVDNRNFSTIGSVTAAGYSNVKLNYGFIDNKPVQFDKPVYYRIAMADRDGSVKYSKIIAVTLKSNGVFVQSVYPNPVEAGKTMHANFVAVASQDIQISLVNATGQTISNYAYNVVKGTNDIKITVPANAGAGVYFLLIKSAGELKKIPVQIR